MLCEQENLEYSQSITSFFSLTTVPKGPTRSWPFHSIMNADWEFNPLTSRLPLPKTPLFLHVFDLFLAFSHKKHNYETNSLIPTPLGICNGPNPSSWIMALPSTNTKKLINLPISKIHQTPIPYIQIYIYTKDFHPSKKKILRFLDNLDHHFSFFQSVFLSFLDFNHSEFPLSSSNNRKLFNFLLLKDGVDEDKDDESLVDRTSLGRIVTRSWGITLGCFLLVSSRTSSCINW